MYLVKVDFGADGESIYEFNDLKSAKEVYDHATSWGLDAEVLKEHKGYQEVIYFLEEE